MTRKPRVFDIGRQDAPRSDAPTQVNAAPRGVTIHEQPDAFPLDNQAPAEVKTKPRKSGFGLLGLAVSALFGFFLLAAGHWAYGIVVDLVNRNAVLGWLAIGFLGIAAAASLVWIGRQVLAIARLRQIETLREKAASAHARKAKTEAEAVRDAIVALYRDRPETAQARARVSDFGGAIVDGDALLVLVERALVTPLDRQAKIAIADSAKRVSLVTALSPRALIDIFFVLAESLRLMRRIAAIYGGRPGAFGSLRLARSVLSHLAVTGGVALGDEALHQLLGQGLAARLSARLGEGILNGLLTARVGLAALQACRPLPFLEAPMPNIRDVAGSLWTSEGDARKTS